MYFNFTNKLQSEIDDFNLTLSKPKSKNTHCEITKLNIRLT